jgi:hypothetical protein
MQLFPPAPENKSELIKHLIFNGIFPVILGLVVIALLVKGFENVDSEDAGIGYMLACESIFVAVGYLKLRIVVPGNDSLLWTLVIAAFLGIFITAFYAIVGFVYIIIDILKFALGKI